MVLLFLAEMKNKNHTYQNPQIPNNCDLRSLALLLACFYSLKCLCSHVLVLAANSMTHPVNTPAPSGFESGNIGHSYWDLYL